MSNYASNKRKDDLLGEPHGTAGSKLRKRLLFKFVKLAGADRCYRCGLQIERVEDLSIEHTESWQLAASPRESFFDLEKIAFSHLQCNVGAAKRTRPKRAIVHGIRGYWNGCRCRPCTKASAEYAQQWARSSMVEPTAHNGEDAGSVPAGPTNFVAT